MCLLNYVKRNTPNFHDKCKITLNDKTFTYENLNSDYVTIIEYKNVIEVIPFQERGIEIVRISMESNFELTCVNLNDSEEFVNLIRTQTNL